MSQSVPAAHEGERGDSGHEATARPILLLMLRAGQVIQLVTVALLGIAVVMVMSAGMTIGGEGGFTAESLIRSQAVQYALASVVLLILASRLDIRHVASRPMWRNPVVWMMIGSLVLVGLTFIPGIGLTINGARRWLRLGPSSWGRTFQPSELVKWVMVLALACWCASRQTDMRRFWRGLVPASLLVAFACGLIVIEDLGTAALVAAVAGIVLVAGGARIWQLGLMTVPAGAAVYWAITTSPYRMARLTSFLDPWQDAQGSGYQAIQSMVAISGGGPTGRGLGNGIQKFEYLPADTTDMVFSVVCEEMGVAGAAAVITLFVVMLWAGLGVVKHCRDTFGRLVALGVVMTVGLQAVINIAVVTVVVPTKGIALPLVSSGGTGWLVTAFALGLVAALDNDNHLLGQASLDVEDEIYDDVDVIAELDDEPETDGVLVPA